jgi:hypothetical protein
MGKLRITVLIVSITPMILSIILYLLLKNKRFVKAFFNNETVNQTEWLPWLLVTLGWFLVSIVMSLLFDL